MTFVLSPFVGSGSEADPYRVPGARAIIDFRADPTSQDGWALARLADDAEAHDDAVTFLDARLPDAATSRMSKQVRDRIADRLNIDVPDDPFGPMVMGLLLEGGPGRWAPLRAMRDRYLRVYCGGLLHEQPIPAGGSTFVDEFDYPDGPLGDVDRWTEVGGDQQIVDGDVEVRASSTAVVEGVEASSPDHYGQITVVGGIPQTSGVDRGIGVWLRSDGTTANGYRMNWNDNSFHFAHGMHKWVDGSATALVNTSGTHPSAPFDARFEADGSTLTGYSNNSQVIQATDSALSGLRLGVRHFYSSGDFLRFGTYEASPVVFQARPNVRIDGTFEPKLMLVRIDGTFVEKPVNVKVDGTFQPTG